MDASCTLRCALLNEELSHGSCLRIEPCIAAHPGLARLSLRTLSLVGEFQNLGLRAASTLALAAAADARAASRQI